MTSGRRASAGPEDGVQVRRPCPTEERDRGEGGCACREGGPPRGPRDRREGPSGGPARVHGSLRASTTSASPPTTSSGRTASPPEEKLRLEVEALKEREAKRDEEAKAAKEREERARYTRAATSTRPGSSTTSGPVPTTTSSFSLRETPASTPWPPTWARPASCFRSRRPSQPMSARSASSGSPRSRSFRPASTSRTPPRRGSSRLGPCQRVLYNAARFSRKPRRQRRHRVQQPDRPDQRSDDARLHALPVTDEAESRESAVRRIVAKYAGSSGAARIEEFAPSADTGRLANQQSSRTATHQRERQTTDF